MKTEIEIMLQLQDKMNTKVHESWQSQGFAFFRAAWIECGELIEHHGYKWWKKQSPDVAQVQLEVVDIWHFGLSMLFDGRDISTIADDLLTDLKQGSVEALSIIDATEALAESLLRTRQFDVAKFWTLMIAADLNFDDLFKQYVGKNVLNLFRQDHGYKDGSYIKIWNGREDNEHLSDLLNSLETVDVNLADSLYQTLEATYSSLER